MVMSELLCERSTRSFLIDECRITEFFSGYIVNFVKHDPILRPVRSPSLKNSILNVMADRPESSTSAVAHHQVQALNPGNYLLRVGETTMCAAAGLHGSCAE
ncbi:hypothetical protein TNCV_3331451 [Trichonephila clavipes]|nr:hypothetical protein TNCV_3331451 [Trichonephila clavipes]